MQKKELTKAEKDKYDKILKDSSIDAEKDKLTKNKKVDLKAYAIKQKIKLKKYVRN